jgi:hypothetical protein
MTADDDMRLVGIILQLATLGETILYRSYLQNDVELYRCVEFITFQLCQAKAEALKMTLEKNLASL